MAVLDERNAANPFVARLRLTGLALCYLLLCVPLVVLFVTTAVSMALIVLGIGLALLTMFLPLLRAFANQHRRMADLVLGGRTESPYLPVTDKSQLGRIGVWITDPATWRDLLWALTSLTIGILLTWVSLVFFLSIIWYVVFPLVFGVTGDVFETNYGFFVIDRFAKSFFEWVWLIPAILLWWYGTPRLIRLRARLDRALLAPSREHLERRVAEVAESRAETVDHSAAELRRIERDLHDGAQARLVSLGMNLGMAEQALKTDPEEAARLLEEARNATTTALGDLRSVVRGIHPPVLADRGLDGAVRALALDMAVPVDVSVGFDGRPPAPVESAAYFAVAEMLANIGKHAEASRATIDLRHIGEVLRMTVSDDGRGGADIDAGTGLAGVRRRLAAFDGTMEVVSPAGGPTTVTMELPCVLSSPKTSPS